MQKVLIVDHDRAMQTALSDILADEGFKSIVTGNGKKAIREIKAKSPDLTILYESLPGIDGMEFLRQIRSIDSSLPIIILTGNGDIRNAVEAIKLGAFDYMTKPFDNDEIVDKIKNALQENCSREEQSVIILSTREKEVLLWLKQGKSSWDISAILEISERTVNFHVNNIMKKLNVVSRTHAVAVALEKGLIPSS